jgi:hypothetical protein
MVHRPSHVAERRNEDGARHGRKTLVGDRTRNPENPGGYITVVAGREDAEYLIVQRTRAQWEGPRQNQEQVNRRIADISSQVEPLNAKSAEVLAYFNKEEMLMITLGIAPV